MDYNMYIYPMVWIRTHKDFLYLKPKHNYQKKSIENR